LEPALGEPFFDAAAKLDVSAVALFRRMVKIENESHRAFNSLS